jgi:hypothetical protein
VSGLTLVRLYEELHSLGYRGSYAAVRRYAIAWREKRAGAKADAYVPLTCAPGEAYQFDSHGSPRVKTFLLQWGAFCRTPVSRGIWFLYFGPFQARSICRHLVFAARRARVRRGSRMRRTGEAGIREAYVLDARLVVSPKMFASSERLSHSVGSIKLELVQLRDPWSEPDCMTRSVSRAGSNSHTVAARNGRTPIPRAPRQWLRRTRPFWSSAFEAKSNFGSFTWIRPDLSGPGDLRRVAGPPLGGFHHGPFDDNAGGDILPQRHQQLARQSDDRCLLHAAAVAFDPFMEPAR